MRSQIIFRQLIKNSRQIIVGVLCLVAIILLVVIIYQENKQSFAVGQLPESQRIKASPDRIINYTDYQSIDDDSEAIIKYAYVSSQEIFNQNYRGLPEDLSLRTGNSQVFIKEAAEDKTTYVGKFYSGDQFFKRGDNWYQIEIATTTKSAFLLQTAPLVLDRIKNILGQPAFAATYYAGSGDGFVGIDSSGGGTQTWSWTHDNAVGQYDISSLGYIRVQVSGDDPYNDRRYTIDRAFIPVDSSALPDDAGVTAASLNIYISYKSDGYNDAYGYITVVQTTQNSDMELSLADYNECGATTTPIEGIDTGERKDISIIDIDGYLSFSLNSVGQSWISKTGYTRLGLREGHDTTNNAINYQDATENYIIFYSSEASGTGQDPYLEVTYAVPTRVKIDGGRLKLDGERLKID